MTRFKPGDKVFISSWYGDSPEAAVSYMETEMEENGEDNETLNYIEALQNKTTLIIKSKYKGFGASRDKYYYVLFPDGLTYVMVAQNLSKVNNSHLPKWF